MPRQPHSATFLLAAAGLIACTQQDVTVVAPTPRSTAVRPVPTPGTTPTPAAAPTGLSSPTPAPVVIEPAALDPGAFDVAEPLPSPAVTSDLAPEEDTLVAAALASDELSAYLRTDLIHDGGVVLYRLLAAPGGASGHQVESGAREPDAGTGKSPDPAKGSPGPGAPLPASATLAQRSAQAGDETVDEETRKRPVQRKVEKRGGRQLELKQQCEPGENCSAGKRRVQAQVAVQQIASAEVVDATGKVAARSYAEVFRRQVVLRPEGNRLALEALGPFSVQAAGQLTGLNIRSVSFGPVDAAPAQAWRADDRPVRLADLPVLAAGTPVRVQLHIDQPVRAGVVVLAGFPGQRWAERVRLVATGLDPTAGDFAGTVIAPAKAGPTHLIVEAVDARSLLPTRPYRSLSLGFSTRVVTTP